MLIIGNKNCIPDNYKGNFAIYSLLADGTGYPSLDILPPATIVNYGGKEFDMMYIDWILNNDFVFFEFFSKIVYNLYLGLHVYIICERNDFYDPIVESILKIMQQRYGYNGAMINEPEDIDYLDQDISFSGLIGVKNLDDDKERFTRIYATFNTYTGQDGSVLIRGYENV